VALRRPLAKPRAQSRTTPDTMADKRAKNSGNQRLILSFPNAGPATSAFTGARCGISATTIPDLLRNSPPLAPRNTK
jgi:hypothetical protein